MSFFASSLRSLSSKAIRRPHCLRTSCIPEASTTSTSLHKQPQQRRYVHARGIEFLQNHDPDLTDSQRTVREAIGKVCSQFDDQYWADAEAQHRFPIEFQQAIARDGWLGICMPSEHGGSDLGIAEAATMMQTISESGGAYAACSSVHMNIFGLEPVRLFGTDEQKKRMLEPLIAGRERACFGVTEPNTGVSPTRPPHHSHVLAHR